jgi:hypothetical protein
LNPKERAGRKVAGVLVGRGDVPGIPIHVVLTERIILEGEALRGLNCGENGKPAFQAVHPERAKSAISVIDQHVSVQIPWVTHTPMLVLWAG